MKSFDAAWARLRVGASIAIAVVLAAGCASATHKAPVEQRQPAPRPTASTATVKSPAAPVTPPPATAPLPGAENAGKPGYYTVKPGDTMIRIGLDAGQNWRDIARWNSIENPNLIEVGQVLRVVPPGVDVVAVRPVAAAGPVETRPLESTPAAAGPPAAAAPSVPSAPASATVPATRDADEDLGWAWPSAGPVLANFDENKTKGLVIGGQQGDPVLAAAAGRVVYAGSGLRGYGNLVIVKHNATYLSAYAHNQTLLVKEDEVVRRGQKIAEMGSTDADRVQLHFEIRRQGRPTDPSKLLPPR